MAWVKSVVILFMDGNEGRVPDLNWSPSLVADLAKFLTVSMMGFGFGRIGTD